MIIEIKQQIKLLDFVLQYFPEISVTKAKKMILYNCFFLQGASIKSFEFILHKGDTIEYRKYNGGQHLAKEKRDVTILYEDNNVIVINKTSTQGVLESTNKKDSTLYSLTKSYLKRKYHKNELYVIFAPEKDECGLCLMAKNKFTKNFLENQKQDFKFNIAAVVVNPLKHKKDKIKFFVKSNKNQFLLGPSNDKDFQTVFLQYNTIDSTTYNDKTYTHICIEQKGIEAFLNRFLLKELGNPVLGDNKFNKQQSYKFQLRYCINSIEFVRPLTSKKLKIECSIPKNFFNFGK